METKPLLSNGGIVFMAFYLSSLILIGFWGRLKRKEESLSDFFPLSGEAWGCLFYFSPYTRLNTVGTH